MLDVNAPTRFEGLHSKGSLCLLSAWCLFEYPSVDDRGHKVLIDFRCSISAEAFLETKNLPMQTIVKIDKKNILTEVWGENQIKREINGENAFHLSCWFVLISSLVSNVHAYMINVVNGWAERKKKKLLALPPPRLYDHFRVSTDFCLLSSCFNRGENVAQLL